MKQVFFDISRHQQDIFAVLRLGLSVEQVCDGLKVSSGALDGWREKKTDSQIEKLNGVAVQTRQNEAGA